MTWQPPVPLRPYLRNYNRPEVDWSLVVEGIKDYGIRNAAQMCIAPTGTISTVAGVEGYGCEPVFALAYNRNVYQAAGDDQQLTLAYVSPFFVKALNKLGISDEERRKIVDEVIETGSCANVEGIPDEVKNVFVVSSDISPKEHILMQASIQAFVDNSISKTCNFPKEAKKEDVADAYIKGWELGCKGLTVYITGSRKEVVLETKETKKKKSGSVLREEKPRSYRLSGATYKVVTPQGKAFVTVNKDENNHPVEVFVNVGKAGTDVAALSEALGRLLSGWLRVSRDPLRTVKEIVIQLIDIGGSRRVGFGSNRVSSIPDAVAKVLAEEFNVNVRINGNIQIEQKETFKSKTFPLADMCPECGNSALVQEEGCAKCYLCGYSIC
jgi:ribonucleoside-diphosphate reductase alpha chain